MDAIWTGIRGGWALWLQAPAAGGGITFFAMMAFMVAIIYVLMILPQQRRQKKWQAMLSQLKPGDKIVTTGGIRGTIMSLKDDAITLRVPPDNLKLEVSRSFVSSVTTPEEVKKE